MRRAGSCIIFLILVAVAVLPLTEVEKIPIAVMDFKVMNFQKSEIDLFLDFFNQCPIRDGHVRRLAARQTGPTHEGIGFFAFRRARRPKHDR
jgi:hypothetical protein